MPNAIELIKNMCGISHIYTYHAHHSEQQLPSSARGVTRCNWDEVHAHTLPFC